jgi:hypothetical protein
VQRERSRGGNGLGYIQRTPGWVGPLRAKDRTTYWGVVPTRPGRGERGLPPHPRDAPLPETFDEWYHVASAHLGLAERGDLGFSHIFAGGALIGLQFAGLLPVVTYGFAALGLPLVAPDPPAVVAGATGLIVTWAGWIWLRYRWSRAWKLRKAWSGAIYDPVVLALPPSPVAPGVERDIDTDPEATHPYRARGLFRIADRPFDAQVVLLVGGFYGHTDRVRGPEAARSWLLAAAFVLVLAGAVVVPFLWGRGPAWADAVLLAAVLAAGPPFLSAVARQVRRLRLAYQLLRLERADRQRWIGWQMLREPEGTPADAGPQERWAESERLRTKTRRKSDPDLVGLSVRVLPVPVPTTGKTSVVPGRWTLDLSDGGRTRLTPADPGAGVLEVQVAGLISDAAMLAHPLTRGGTQWLVLSDDSHIPVDCRDFAGLHDAAEAVGIHVVRPT